MRFKALYIFFVCLCINPNNNMSNPKSKVCFLTVIGYRDTCFKSVKKSKRFWGWLKLMTLYSVLFCSIQSSMTKNIVTNIGFTSGFNYLTISILFNLDCNG